MESVKDIKRAIKTVTVKSGADVHGRVLKNLLQTLEASANQTAVKQASIWSLTMNSMKRTKVKMAIAAMVLLVFAGLVPFNGTSALGRITNEVATTMARLKAMVLGEEVPETEHVALQIDKSVKIRTRGRVYSSAEISLLEGFLDDQSIGFVTADYGNGKYAAIASGEVAALEELLESSQGYSVATCPTVITYSGQEAMIAIVNTAGLAITAVWDENSKLILDCTFHNGQEGCEISGIELEKGDALLISGIGIAEDESSEKIMTVLVLPEVIEE